MTTASLCWGYSFKTVYDTLPEGGLWYSPRVILMSKSPPLLGHTSQAAVVTQHSETGSTSPLATQARTYKLTVL